jgi:hypothetical protein
MTGGKYIAQEEMRNEYKILLGKPQGERSLRRLDAAEDNHNSGSQRNACRKFLQNIILML